MLSGWVSHKWPGGKSCSCCSLKGDKWQQREMTFGIRWGGGREKWPAEASLNKQGFSPKGSGWKAIKARCPHSSLETQKAGTVSLDRWPRGPSQPRIEKARAYPSRIQECGFQRKQILTLQKYCWSVSKCSLYVL